MAAYRRTAIRPFSLANPAYVGAKVYFFTVDLVTGLKTSTMATLYAGTTGVATLTNPQTLDSNGKFAVPVYHDVPVIGVLQEALVPDHETGVLFPSTVADLTDVTATSVSSVTIGDPGPFTITVEAGKGFAPGMPVTVAVTASPATNAIYGGVTAYNSSTGSLTFSKTNSIGAGTHGGSAGALTITLKGDRGEVGATGSVNLGNATPQAPGTAAAGASANAARDDHVHPREIDATTAAKGIVQLATAGIAAGGASASHVLTPAAQLPATYAAIRAL